jgi:hypothetical protein
MMEQAPHSILISEVVNDAGTLREWVNGAGEKLAWIKESENQSVEFGIMITCVPVYSESAEGPAENGLDEMKRVSSQKFKDLYYSDKEGVFVGQFQKSHNANLVVADLTQTFRGWVKKL